jgi:hypothetical protein
LTEPRFGGECPPAEGWKSAFRRLFAACSAGAAALRQQPFEWCGWRCNRAATGSHRVLRLHFCAGRREIHRGRALTPPKPADFIGSQDHVGHVRPDRPRSRSAQLEVQSVWREVE